MGSLCIIPARGSSKRIPRKNIKEFLGKPIIAYSIEAALKSNLFDEVMVSTDDDEIASTAQYYGAKVPFLRSKKNSDDYATTVDVLLEVLDAYKKNGRAFDYLFCLYPCAPLIKIENLKKSYEILNKNDFDSIIPVIRFSYPFQRSFRIDDKSLAYFYPEYEKIRSQDLDPAFHDAGQFYAIKVASFLKNKTLIPNNTSYILLSELEVQDIDNYDDWKLAELKYKLQAD